MDFLLMTVAETRNLGIVGGYSIETHCDELDTVRLKCVSSGKSEGPYDFDALADRIPEILENENICVYAAVMLHIIYGWYHIAFTDAGEIEKFRSSEECRIDPSQLALPYVEGKMVIFFARGFLITNDIYKISGPCPTCRKSRELHFSATILPVVKPWPRAEIQVRHSKRKRMDSDLDANCKCLLL